MNAASSGRGDAGARRRRSFTSGAADVAAGTGLGPPLLAFLLIGSLYASFAGGAIEIADESRLQIAIYVAALVAGLGLCAGALKAGRDRLAWGGVALLAAFGLWSAFSIGWSAAPDLSWTASNRALAYAAVAAIALLASASTREAPALTALFITAVSVAVALYALAGKIAPEIDILGLSFDQTARFARLREPIGYWNALGLLCVLGSPTAIWLAASRSPARWVRIGMLLTLCLLATTCVLTYSRGAVIGFIAVVFTMVASGTPSERIPRLVVALGSVAAALPAVVLAFGRHDLSTGGLSASERAGDGALLALVLALSMAALACVALSLIPREEKLNWTKAQRRRGWRVVRFAALASLVLVVLGAGATGRFLPTEVVHQVSSFRDPNQGPANTPDRLISTNGSNRYIWWQEAAGAFSDKPLKGWGAGSYPVVRNLYRRFEAPVRSTHSVTLQFLSETGLVGAALGLGGLALLGMAALRRMSKTTGAERAARSALLAVSAAWIVHAQIDWDWEIPAVTIPALVAAGVAAAPVPERAQRTSPVRHPLLSGAALGLVSIALALSALAPAMSNAHRLAALRELSQVDDGDGNGSLEKAAEEADLAARLDPLAVEPVLTQSTIASQRNRVAQIAGKVAEATETQPDNWRGWQARLDVDIGDLQLRSASRDLTRLTETDPLTYGRSAGTTSAIRFALAAPASLSPTAYGTPPENP